jgi:DNA invertase Pin-like site-specific DNA recombinase
MVNINFLINGESTNINANLHNEATAEIPLSAETESVQTMMDSIRAEMTTNANTRKTVRTSSSPVMKWFPPDADKIRAQFAKLLTLGYTDITIGFWRVSDGQQATEDSYGPEAQIKAVTAWCIANTDRGVDIWIHDIESGQTESRVGVDLVREFVASGKVRNVVSYKYDRLARSQYLSELLDKEFGKVKCKWMSATEDLPGGALGRLIKQLLMAIAQFEAALIAQRMAGGKKIAVQKKGIFSGGEVPYGYLSKGQRGDTGKGVLVKCESEAKVIKLIFYLYSVGYSQTAIANFLNDQNVPTRNGGKLGWRQGQIRRIIIHEAAYRAEALFSTQCLAPDMISHDAILPSRPADQRTYMYGTITPLPQGTQIPADIHGEPLPMAPRPNSMHCLTEVQAKTLLRVFELRDSGLSQKKVCEQANAEGLTTLEGRSWKQSNLHLMLQRRDRYDATITAMGVTQETIVNEKKTSAEFAEGLESERKAESRIREMRDGGRSIKSIVDNLDAEGYRTRRGAKWHCSTVDRVLKGHLRREGI